jgi:hypothetical protein
MNESNKTLLIWNYILPPWVSLYTLFMSDKKDDPTCKFHGWQSLFLGIIAYFTCGLGGLYSWYYAYKLYTGEEMEIPKLTDMAKSQANK